MNEGNIIGDRYDLKWLPKDKKLFMGLWAIGGINLGKSGGLFGVPKVKAFMCNICNKLVIDLNEKGES